ncbi:ATP-binding cassette domain-containing protein [Sphingobium sp. B2]|uniref:ATP-binding cassette domain-containing protein n=1 Tax=Sphingobium sp. B2 TaxID=2583228 RepID=UPI0021BD444C|nr:ATP-binding cassette domain-containing protein [Sphingobium sp. B2]
MSEMLAFEGVSLVLGGARVLDRIDLHIGAGERVAIVGESGAGKGWLLRLAVGLAEPGSGMVRLMGVALDEADTDQRRLLRARCGLAMQGGSLLGDLTVEENMRLALGRMGGRDARARRRIDRLLLEYGLEQAADIRADMLSIGERRRAELARAFTVSYTHLDVYKRQQDGGSTGCCWNTGWSRRRPSAPTCCPAANGDGRNWRGPSCAIRTC